MDNASYQYIRTQAPSITYEQFIDYNNYKKHLQFRPVQLRNVYKKRNELVYSYIGDKEKSFPVSITTFIYTNAPIYITNPSKLKDWNGFNTSERVFIHKNIIQQVSSLIPFSLFQKDKTECNTQTNSLKFKLIPKEELSKFLLRNKIAYTCSKLQDHIWYINNNYNITIFSDIPMYTPIESVGLFTATRFLHIDLHNISTAYTLKFDHAFYNSMCKSLDFGNNVKISKFLSSQMFDDSDDMFSDCSINQVFNAEDIVVKHLKRKNLII